MGLMLSRPRNPPPNRLLPSGSCRFSHQVKFSSSFWKTRSRKSRSVPPSMTNTRSAASACTGGLTSSKFHSYAGSAPFGCRNHSRSSTSSWYLANAGSRCAQAIAWNARSQAANHGYSHGSGMASTSKASRCRQPGVAAGRCAGRRRWSGRVAVEPSVHPVRVHLLAPDQARRRPAGGPASARSSRSAGASAA